MVGCIDLNLNYSLIDGCPSYLNNVRQIWWMFVMYDRRHILWISISNEYHRCPMNTKMMNVHHLPIWWMSIIYENGECPSFKMYARRVLGCQSYMMDVHHIWGITVINGTGEMGNNWLGDWYLMKLMEPMKIVGWVKFFHWWNGISETK